VASICDVPLRIMPKSRIKSGQEQRSQEISVSCASAERMAVIFLPNLPAYWRDTVRCVS